MRTLLEWMQGHGPLVTTAQALQKTPRTIRNLKAKGIGLLLEELIGRGYIRPAPGGWEVRHGV